MSRATFNHMRWAFQHRMQINSLYVTVHRLAVLARIQPQWIDCCVNSCRAYEDDLSSCPDCKQPCFIPKGTPRRVFCYLLLIPQLQRLFLNKEQEEFLLYHHHYSSNNNDISDVFDSAHYKDLQQWRVEVDGTTLDHTYFANPTDLALGLCLDGYLLFKGKCGPSATPILLKDYNLESDIRTHRGNLICLGVIPGLHSPKHLHTFL